MRNNNNSDGKGCTPFGCVGTVIVVSLIVTFIFGNKELGKDIFDYGFKIIGGLFLLGVLIYIYLDGKK